VHSWPGALLGSVLWPPRPLLVWNATASSPIGLYRISHAREIAPGDMVLARPPEAARRLAAERRYLPANVPLVKQVAAAHGDRVCALGEALFVNGRFLALRRREDAAGRPLLGGPGAVSSRRISCSCCRRERRTPSTAAISE
jgi:type IV secretory pathway protease TraF